MKAGVLFFAVAGIMALYAYGATATPEKIEKTSSLDVGRFVSVQGKVVSEKRFSNAAFMIVCAKACVQVISFKEKNLAGKKIVVEGTVDAKGVVIARKVEDA